MASATGGIYRGDFIYGETGCTLVIPTRQGRTDMTNPRVRIIDAATSTVVVVDRVSAEWGAMMAATAKVPPTVFVIGFQDEVELGDVIHAAPATPGNRVPAAELRRPDLPSQRHPEDDLGTEALPG